MISLFIKNKMPRPQRIRRIYFDPRITNFRPAGFDLSSSSEVILTREELEAIRLIDYEKNNQAKAAKNMKISQPTLSRILVSARNKISVALIDGSAIKIEGGNFKMVQPRRSLGAGRGLGAGSGGRGRMGGFAAGPGGVCKCTNPDCGYEEPQIRGVPCSNKKCPKCGSAMTRKL